MPDRNSHGLSPDEVVDQYFLEHRAKLLDLAAFLDRVDDLVTLLRRAPFQILEE